MPTLTNPSEIAREAFRLLASRRMSPSPENYQALYHEIAGISAAAATPFPERELKALLNALPKEKPAQQRLLKRFEQAFKGKTWEELKRGLGELFAQLGKEQELPWSELFGDFLRQWEGKQAGLTVARKREAFERLLAGAAGNSELLFTRLQSLLRSWSLNAPMAEEIPLVEGEKATPALVAKSSSPADLAAARKALQSSDLAARLSAELSEIFAYTLEVLVPSQLRDEPELVADAIALAHKLRTANSPAAMEGLQAGIKRFAFRLELLAEDRVELRAGLLNLLQLLIENVGELVVEDRWLAGQMAIVSEIVAGPLSLRSIGDAENRLREVIFKQGQLKHSLNEARENLKQMLAGFVDHLAEFADSTSEYHDKIEICADRISAAEDISELEDVLAEVIRETKIIQLNAQRSRDELRSAKQSVDEAEQRIGELQVELEKASTLVRHDQLTGVLNRRGLEEAFEKEAARAQRRQSSLCVALLDIDNFKKLNDTLGHDAGDAALIHLTAVIRETMRPQDTVARFGGEEFIILLPDTQLEDAQTALVRLQRELTRRIFLHDNNRQLITFSAGLSDLRAGDTQASVSKRADEAMFAAKQAGKNRVLIG
ncbi:MAG: GGDEF domain-containing protein [Candidatus Accumulibacter phosphatis]|jgi:diguanylate cyclase|uniref:diguanylate cyclase n=1 Tax=Candidatus Accumulibacter phosphatis TaxID=327160 RepID=A0A6A7RVC4_9PROT|nr:GGDEF domain-containing protein [Candidatus Accumulibacter phosphatis]